MPEAKFGYRMNSADCLLAKMKRKQFMGPQGALIVYLLHLEASVRSDRQLLLRKIPAVLRRYGANLLHCRSPLPLALRARQ